MNKSGSSKYQWYSFNFTMVLPSTPCEEDIRMATEAVGEQLCYQLLQQMTVSYDHAWLAEDMHGCCLPNVLETLANIIPEYPHDPCYWLDYEKCSGRPVVVNMSMSHCMDITDCGRICDSLGHFLRINLPISVEAAFSKTDAMLFNICASDVVTPVLIYGHIARSILLNTARIIRNRIPKSLQLPLATHRFEFSHYVDMKMETSAQIHLGAILGSALREKFLHDKKIAEMESIKRFILDVYTTSPNAAAKMSIMTSSILPVKVSLNVFCCEINFAVTFCRILQTQIDAQIYGFFHAMNDVPEQSTSFTRATMVEIGHWLTE